MQYKITIQKIVFILAGTVLIVTFAKPSEKKIEECHSSVIDQSWNANDNKYGADGYNQVQKVRKLEFDPRFDCSKEIRLRWQREIDIADKMKCKNLKQINKPIPIDPKIMRSSTRITYIRPA